MSPWKNRALTDKDSQQGQTLENVVLRHWEAIEDMNAVRNELSEKDVA